MSRLEAPMSGKCPDCGKQLVTIYTEIGEHGRRLEILHCKNSDCKNNDDYIK